MHICSDTRRLWASLLILAFIVIAVGGCSRKRYRLQADREAYHAIEERNVDPRWSAPDISIEPDPRSRFFDRYNPDRSPMPVDDPASHQYMCFVDGRKGWKHWYANGKRMDLVNVAWRDLLPEYVETTEEGSIKIDIDSALRLAYLHSPNHQTQLETLYLSALDVTAERFRLDTQFFGGYDANYVHNGSLIPPALRFVPAFGRFVVNPAIGGPGVENNRLTVGRPFAADPALLARRRLATAGELLVGFANSFVFEFTGGDADFAASLANFSFIQPLLRGAGKDVALEQLTVTERTLLANLRAYSQFRQGFYTQVAIGELGVTGPQRGGSGTNLMSFSGDSFVGGYFGLLQQRQQIRNSEDLLSLQLRTLARLEAFRDAGVIDRVQVEEFRQSVERERARLLQSRVFFELTLDRYKTGTVGLPPDVPIDLDHRLIRQFQLVGGEGNTIQDSIVDLQRRLGAAPEFPPMEVISQLLSQVLPLVEPIRRRFDEARDDLARMDEMAPSREQTMNAEDRKLFRRDREELRKRLADEEQKFLRAAAELERLRSELSKRTREETRRRLVTWVGDVLRRVEGVAFVQARARLELITVPTIDLESHQAFEIALANRLDFMNGRAALVDRWRLIQFNADALQSVLDVTASGDIRTARNNPVSFRAPTGRLQFGLEFDAPFTRLLERNAYRESLIDYQRSRRSFIQSRDSLHLGLRALLRQLEQLRATLEIQRRSVTIAIGRVDLTQLALAAPVEPARPGGGVAQFQSTTAINLLGAQSSLRDTQNEFLSVWLNYYAARMRLARELGVMMLDREGRWIEPPTGSNHDGMGNGDEPKDVSLPPPIPDDWVEVVDPSPSVLAPAPQPAVERLPPLSQ